MAWKFPLPRPPHGELSGLVARNLPSAWQNARTTLHVAALCLMCLCVRHAMLLKLGVDMSQAWQRHDLIAHMQETFQESDSRLSLRSGSPAARSSSCSR